VGIEAINTVGRTAPVQRDLPVSTPVRGANFASALQRRLDQPRAEIDQIRAEVSSFRDGGALRNLPNSPVTEFMNAGSGSIVGGALGAPSSPGEVAALLARQATGNASDPYGWREMSRQVGDSVIGPGYGAMFERQIQQESGFAPDVVMGQRRSSAGAEGIAQLMPQFYQHVNRTDPAQSLHAGAQSMKQYLTVFNGDVRKALASYNSGMGTVQSAVTRGGAAWESYLPQETRDYLGAIVGGTRPVFSPVSGFSAGFGGGAGAGLPASLTTGPGTLGTLGGRGASAVAQAGLASSLRSLGGFGMPGE